METLVLLFNFIKDISWQIIVITIVFLLRKEFRQIFVRLQQAKIPGAGDYTFYQPESSFVPKEKKSVDKQKIKVQWANVANIYWVGYDIMFTMDALLRNGSKKHIIYGLTQVLHHVKELDFSDEEPEIFAEQILAKVKASLESELDVTTRRNIAGDVATLRDQIGVLFEIKQESFRASPSDNDSTTRKRLALINH